MNRSRAKGTRAETSIVRFLLGEGIPAHRVALRGDQDHGDIWVAGGRMVIEVKARASLPTHAEVARWQGEAQDEASRVPHADIAVLVVKRPGSGQVGQWWAWMDHADWVWIDSGVMDSPSFWMCMDMAALVGQLQRLGWAD